MASRMAPTSWIALLLMAFVFCDYVAAQTTASRQPSPPPPQLFLSSSEPPPPPPPPAKQPPATAVRTPPPQSALNTAPSTARQAPPTTFQAPPMELQDTPGTAVKMKEYNRLKDAYTSGAANSASVSFFLEALEASSLSAYATMSNPQVTFLIPTNEAFNEYFSKVGLTEAQVLKNSFVLTALLEYHITGRVFSSIEMFAYDSSGSYVPSQYLDMLNNQSAVAFINTTLDTISIWGFNESFGSIDMTGFRGLITSSTGTANAAFYTIDGVLEPYPTYKLDYVPMKHDNGLMKYFYGTVYATTAVFSVLFVAMVTPSLIRCMSCGRFSASTPGQLSGFLRSLATARKQLMYALLDVNDYNGQSRTLLVLMLTAAAVFSVELFNQQWGWSVDVESLMKLSTGQEYGLLKMPMTYPLQQRHFKDWLEEQGYSKFVSRLLPWLFTICVAILVGFMTWMSQVANYSSPKCELYRTQCWISWVGFMSLSWLVINNCVFYIRYHNINGYESKYGEVDRDYTIDIRGHTALMILLVVFLSLSFFLQLKVTVFSSWQRSTSATAGVLPTKRAESESTGWLARSKTFFRSLYHDHISEQGSFKFPAWFLAAVLTSIIVLAYHTAVAVTFVKRVSTCVSDLPQCVQYFYYGRFESSDNQGVGAVFSIRDWMSANNISTSDLVNGYLSNNAALSAAYYESDYDLAGLVQSQAQETDNIKPALDKAADLEDALAWAMFVLGNNLLKTRYVGLIAGSIISFFTIVVNTVRFRAIALQYHKRKHIDALLKGHHLTRGQFWSEEDAVVKKARAAPIHRAIYIFAALTSVVIWQMYIVTFVVSFTLAILTHDWFWSKIIPVIGPGILATITMLVISILVINRYFGATVFTDTTNVTKAGAFLAYSTIFSIALVALSFFLALIRVLILILTTILGMGRLDTSIFTYFQAIDIPHQSYMSTIHFAFQTADMSAKHLKPGPKYRPHRLWHSLKKHVVGKKREDLRKALYGDVEQGADVVVRAAVPGSGSGSGVVADAPVRGRDQPVVVWQQGPGLRPAK